MWRAVALVDEAVSRIRELIRSGELPAGCRLPAEQRLAAQLGISRNTAREAVKILASARVLDVRRGDGTYVTSLTPQLLLEGLGFAVDLLHERHLLEVVEVRRMLEPQAAAAAASRVSEADLEGLAEHLARMDKAASRSEAMVDHDIAFHRRIAQASGNALLTSMLDALSRHTLRALVWRGITDEPSAAQAIAEHRAIHQALVQRNPAVAYAAALVHVNTTEQRIRQCATVDGTQQPA